ncbi:MAG TPA: hypothetical protein VH414_09465 [Lichenihabitans sp.]|jgi:hypothetical protein|nr:hypothetical protein [Lichenihabitans sp.]
MVTVTEIERHRLAARQAFDSHADAMGKLIRGNRALTTEMCRWMSMNVSVFDDVATALAAGASGTDEVLQRRVADEVAALRRRDPDMAATFELALIEGLRSAILLRLARPEGATENGRRALLALLGASSWTLVPQIVDLGMAARLKRGRLRRIGAALGAGLTRVMGLPNGALPFGPRNRPVAALRGLHLPDRPEAVEGAPVAVASDENRDTSGHER